MTMIVSTNKAAFSLLELLAVTLILGLLAALIVPRVAGNDEIANIAACYVYKGDIEVQAEIWKYNTGSWPATNLAAIGADLNYFPEGLPTCPVDGNAYTIDTSTGLVIGHNHLAGAPESVEVLAVIQQFHGL